jgi:hypothetical protein
MAPPRETSKDRAYARIRRFLASILCRIRGLKGLAAQLPEVVSHVIMLSDLPKVVKGIPIMCLYGTLYAGKLHLTSASLEHKVSGQVVAGLVFDRE